MACRHAASVAVMTRMASTEQTMMCRDTKQQLLLLRILVMNLSVAWANLHETSLPFGREFLVDARQAAAVLQAQDQLTVQLQQLQLREAAKAAMLAAEQQPAATPAASISPAAAASPKVWPRGEGPGPARMSMA